MSDAHQATFQDSASPEATWGPRRPLSCFQHLSMTPAEFHSRNEGPGEWTVAFPGLGPKATHVILTHDLLPETRPRTTPNFRAAGKSAQVFGKPSDLSQSLGARFCFPLLFPRKKTLLVHSIGPRPLQPQDPAPKSRLSGRCAAGSSPGQP